MPNKIYNATLTNSLNQSGTLDTYVFNFKVTNNIPRYGFIKLRFPSPWTSAPLNIEALTKSIRLQGVPAQSFRVQTPISSDVIYTGLFDLVGLTANPGLNISITLEGIVNPNQIITTGSFQITTMDDAQNEIDKITTGL